MINMYKYVMMSIHCFFGGSILPAGIGSAPSGAPSAGAAVEDVESLEVPLAGEIGEITNQLLAHQVHEMCLIP